MVDDSLFYCGVGVQRDSHPGYFATASGGMTHHTVMAQNHSDFWIIGVLFNFFYEINKTHKHPEISYRRGG